MHGLSEERSLHYGRDDNKETSGGLPGKSHRGAKGAKERPLQRGAEVAGGEALEGA